MSLAWESIQQLARAGNDASVAAALLDATEAERLAFAPAVEAGLKAMKPEDRWQNTRDPSGSFALAVLGTAPTAAKAAALLGRRDMRDKWDRIPVARVIEIVRARRLPWIDDLGQRLAGRLSAQEAWSGGWRFVAAVLAESGGTPPVTEGVVRGWLAQVEQWDEARPYVDRLRDSPYLDLLLPAVFEFSGLGGELNSLTWDDAAKRWTSTSAFPAAVATLVAEGRLERKTILDLTVDRLVRGDRPAFLRQFATLHDLLAPGVDELAGHAPDYARLLPDAPSPVAVLAQRALRAVDDAGLLELDTLLETSRPTLVRKEKALVKAQLSWLDRVARRDTGRVGEVLETVAVAFGHPALDIQDRALTLIERRAAGADAGTLARLAALASGLGGDLPARAAKLFGTGTPAAGSPLAPSAPGSSSSPPFPASLVPLLPPPAGPAEMPPPIATTAELAEEIVALLHEETSVRWERVLAGLVTLRTADDKSALREVLHRHAAGFGDERWRKAQFALGSAIRAFLTPARRFDGLKAAVRSRLAHDRQPRLDTPDRLLTLRVTELAAQLAKSPVLELLATPTHVNGSLDAAVLVDRLRRVEEPWSLDFEQALLRLPRGTGPEVAAGLGSAAGRWLAEWLADGGLPDPVSTRGDQLAGESPAVHSGSPPEVARVLVNLVPARPARLSVEDQLFTLARRATVNHYTYWVADDALLAATLPHHREVSAAWALPGLASMATQDQRGGSQLLPLLAECDGPIGPAMSLGVAYALVARHEADRVAAVDAFLALAAAGEPFAAPVGRDLADLAARGMVKLGRAVAPLTDAHRAGASAAVWELLLAALPTLLPAAPRGLPELLELASQVAATVGARDDVPGLAALAGRKGASRLLQEGRRLRSVLTGQRVIAGLA
jgi:hypothetical protein